MRWFSSEANSAIHLLISNVPPRFLWFLIFYFDDLSCYVDTYLSALAFRMVYVLNCLQNANLPSVSTSMKNGCWGNPWVFSVPYLQTTIGSSTYLNHVYWLNSFAFKGLFDSVVNAVSLRCSPSLTTKTTNLGFRDDTTSSKWSLSSQRFAKHLEEIWFHNRLKVNHLHCPAKSDHGQIGTMCWSA